MKIDARLEKNGGRLRPVLFFPDDIERDKSIGCFSAWDGHASAARAYMRQCKKPESPEEFREVYAVLGRYFTEAAKHV